MTPLAVTDRLFFDRDPADGASLDRENAARTLAVLDRCPHSLPSTEQIALAHAHFAEQTVCSPVLSDIGCSESRHSEFVSTHLQHMI